jgi:hypothetical protein
MSVPQWSRRTFLVASAGVALAACGGSSKRSSGDSSASAQVLASLLSPSPILAPGQQRIPVAIADADGVLLSDGPPELPLTVVDATGKQVAAVVASRHNQGIPRPYWPIITSLPAGTYTASTPLKGGTGEMSFQVVPSDQVIIPKPGDPMIPTVTPTTGDPRGVTPICTRDPACPFHTVSLADALEAGKPTALMIATPAFCKTAVCGPVVDVMVGQLPRFGEALTVVHAEVYTDSTINTPTQAVNDYRLTFEPCLYLADSKGMIAERIDGVYDADELAAALARLTGK